MLETLITLKLLVANAALLTILVLFLVNLYGFISSRDAFGTLATVVLLSTLVFIICLGFLPLINIIKISWHYYEFSPCAAADLPIEAQLQQLIDLIPKG